MPEPVISPYVRMRDLVRSGRRFAVATVVRTHGSTPQTIGAKLVVTGEADERPLGTLGGGCVEADAILAAREVLTNGARSLREYRLNEELAWNTGLVCGGTMWILAERGDVALSIGGQDLVDEVARAAGGGPPVAVVTRLKKDGRAYAFDGRVVVRADGRIVGTLGTPEADERAAEAAVAQLAKGPSRLLVPDDEHELFIEPVMGRPRLIIAGGGHVAKAIARQARLLDFDVTVLEDRPEFTNPERFDGATVLAGEVAETIGSLQYGAQDFLVVATRGHKMDADCVLAAAKTDVGYIGLLGSRRKTVLIADLLREHAIPADRIAAIHAPVGLDLGGRTPAEIALSILAEITQIRHGGTGRALRLEGQGARS
jgi:xanthine dehydrogenase accessory factor